MRCPICDSDKYVRVNMIVNGKKRVVRKCNHCGTCYTPQKKVRDTIITL